MHYIQSLLYLYSACSEPSSQSICVHLLAAQHLQSLAKSTSQDMFAKDVLTLLENGLRKGCARTVDQIALGCAGNHGVGLICALHLLEIERCFLKHRDLRGMRTRYSTRWLLRVIRLTVTTHQ